MVSGCFWGMVIVSFAVTEKWSLSELEGTLLLGNVGGITRALGVLILFGDAKNPRVLGFRMMIFLEVTYEAWLPNWKHKATQTVGRRFSETQNHSDDPRPTKGIGTSMVDPELWWTCGGINPWFLPRGWHCMWHWAREWRPEGTWPDATSRSRRGKRGRSN